MDGDGLDDYLYVSDQGAVVYWRNNGTASATGAPSWGLPHLVADGVGVLAQDVHFADTNGDRLLDYVVVGRVTGITRTWHNLGFQTAADKSVSIRWNTPLSFADRTGSAGFAIKITEASKTYLNYTYDLRPNLTNTLDDWRQACRLCFH